MFKKILGLIVICGAFEFLAAPNIIHSPPKLSAGVHEVNISAAATMPPPPTLAEQLKAGKTGAFTVQAPCQFLQASAETKPSALALDTVDADSDVPSNGTATQANAQTQAQAAALTDTWLWAENGQAYARGQYLTRTSLKPGGELVMQADYADWQQTVSWVMILNNDDMLMEYTGDVLINNSGVNAAIARRQHIVALYRCKLVPLTKQHLLSMLRDRTQWSHLLRLSGLTIKTWF